MVDNEVERPSTAANCMATGAYTAFLAAPLLVLLTGVTAFAGSFSTEREIWYMFAGMLGVAALVTAVTGIVQLVEGGRELAALTERAALTTLESERREA